MSTPVPPEPSTPAPPGELVHVDSHADLTVVGGGLAGVCAAIAAARQGRTVNLIQNRPVLGGNSSSEVRVWVCGATAHGAQSYARETGIMGELWLENQFTNPEGNPYYWDLVLLEKVNAEPNITLWLNTNVQDVSTTDGSDPSQPIEVTSVTGWQQGSEKVIRYTSDAFIDCSGDGLVGHLAGAEYSLGREPRTTYEESWAPEVPDNNTLGSTILFYSKDIGEPSKFVPPSFAVDITKTAIPKHRVIDQRAKGCAYWWIEWGGEFDVVIDNEKVRDELQAVVYGIWNHIKNSGEFEDVENLTLEWIGAVPGKREYRRFVGDHVLTQHDILDQTKFEDPVTFGGWSIDLHPPGGVYATEKGSMHWHPPGTYDIPLRSLYSRNVKNLWFAGRNISASHVAFGSTRVMATCGALGEAAGLAAAVAQNEGLSPRQLATEQFELMRNAMVRNDTSTIGLSHGDEDDLARRAMVTASSTLTLPTANPSGERVAFESDLALMLPAAGRLGRLELLLDVAEDLDIEYEVWLTSGDRNYLPQDHVSTGTVSAAAGEKQWVALDADLDTDEARTAVVVVKADPRLKLWLGDRILPGLIVMTRRNLGPDDAWTEQFREWKPVWEQEGVAVRFADATPAFAPEQVIGAYARPYGGPNMWASAGQDDDPTPHLQLEWDTPVEISEVQLVLDDDVRIDLINLHHHRTPEEVLPSLLRDYDLEIRSQGQWQTVAQVRDNRHRHHRHLLSDTAAGGPVALDAVRVNCLATNGAPSSHIIAVRAYR